MNVNRLEQRLRVRWMEAQPIAYTPEPHEVIRMIEEEIAATQPDPMTRDDHRRLAALDMALRHAEFNEAEKDRDAICKTAELFRRFLSGETVPAG